MAFRAAAIAALQIPGFVAANFVWTRVFAAVAPAAGDEGSPGDPGLLLLAGILLLAVGEELAIRGWLFRALRARFGPGTAIIGSSLVFAALHPPLDAAVVAFLLGLQLGALRLAFGLPMAIGAHVASNLAGSIPWTIPTTAPPAQGPLLVSAAVLIAGIAGAALVQRVRRSLR
ncbi:MAG: CPBP family intramembrane glutamic endopeptidase [Myxococcota bacterium]